MPSPLDTHNHSTARFRAATLFIIIAVAATAVISSCTKTKEHTAPGIYPKDSAAVMTSYGVNTLISDSGVMKYRIVAEQWIVNQNINPSQWIFEKGLFIEQFDDKFHIEAYIQCDTAYYYDIKKLWELRSHVRLRTKDGKIFSSEQLFWDQAARELYSHCHSKIVMPDKEMEGDYFRSDERFTRYEVRNSKGSADKDNMREEPAVPDTATLSADTIHEEKRSPMKPKAKYRPTR